MSAWGLLIGDDDADRLTDETKHILVTFAHRSIQEFFGAFFFILILNEGKTIESLLSGDSEEPIFLTNPLFLEFCLWLMNSTELTSFPWEVETVREPLVTYLAGKIDNEDLNLERHYKDFPALDMATVSDPRVLDLMKDVLSRCSEIERLSIPISWPVDDLLSVVDRHLWGSQIHTLCLFRDYTIFSDKLQQPQKELLIHLIDLPKPLEMLAAALKYCYRAKRRPCIRVEVDRNSYLDLSEFFQINEIHQLHVNCYGEWTRVSCNQDIPSCPSLRQVSVRYLKKGDDVLSGLRKAIQEGHLPNLNYLSFESCSFNREGTLRYLFGSRTPALEHLDLGYVQLNKSDLQFTSELRKLQFLSLSTGPFLQTETLQWLFQNPDASVWATLSVLHVTYIDSEFVEGFVRVVNENKLPNLKELWLSYGYVFLDLSLLKLQAEKLPNLKRLHLSGFVFSGEDVVQDLAQRVVKWDLEFLRIARSKGISGHLSVLFRQCLPSLTDLKLSSCELNSDDVCCLTEVREQGRLPKLKSLHVSCNKIKCPEIWTKNKAWKNVEIIDLR